ncbi:MAG: 4Fe-4S binding protein, partial [Prevotella sp.]|nr:4Fe-4S binding protein [Prevotella sp.]
MLRKIRIALATVMFVGLVLLFLDFTGTLHTWLGWMAKVQFLPAVMALNVGVIVGLVLLTLVFGRIYCSVVCPLGIMQDVFGWFGKRARKNRYSYSKAVSWLRYAVLVLFVVAFVLGIGSIVQLLAPYSAFGRIMTALLQPLWMLGNNVLASVAERIDSYTFYSVDVWMKSLPVFI